jgi:hypothetical protein
LLFFPPLRVAEPVRCLLIWWPRSTRLPQSKTAKEREKNNHCKVFVFAERSPSGRRISDEMIKVCFALLQKGFGSSFYKEVNICSFGFVFVAV